MFLSEELPPLLHLLPDSLSTSTYCSLVKPLLRSTTPSPGKCIEPSGWMTSPILHKWIEAVNCIWDLRLILRLPLVAGSPAMRHCCKLYLSSTLNSTTGEMNHIRRYTNKPWHWQNEWTTSTDLWVGNQVDNRFLDAKVMLEDNATNLIANCLQSQSILCWTSC